MNDSCKLCDSLGVQLEDLIKFTEKSPKMDHVRLHLRQSKLIDEEKMKIAQVFNQCFPKLVDDKQGGDEKLKSRSRILALCKSAFSKLSSPVKCQECNTTMTLYNQSYKCWVWTRIIDHACRHLGKAMYKCSLCDHETSLEQTMMQHVSNSHQLKPKKGENFDDFTSIYEDEIKESIRSCFEKGAPKLTINKVQIKSRMENSVWRCLGTSSNKLKLKRHLLAQRLLAEFSNENGKIQCRVCSNMLAPQRIGNAVDHAEMHLKNDIYKCKKCHKVFSCRPTVRYHMNEKHKVGCSGNYKNRADQFHKEIIEMIEKCFGGKKD